MLISIMVIPSSLNLLLTFSLRGKIEQKYIEVMVFTQQKSAGVEGVEGEGLFCSLFSLHDGI